MTNIKTKELEVLKTICMMIKAGEVLITPYKVSKCVKDVSHTFVYTTINKYAKKDKKCQN